MIIETANVAQIVLCRTWIEGDDKFAWVRSRTPVTGVESEVTTILQSSTNVCLDGDESLSFLLPVTDAAPLLELLR